MKSSYFLFWKIRGDADKFIICGKVVRIHKLSSFVLVSYCYVKCITYLYITTHWIKSFCLFLTKRAAMRSDNAKMLLVRVSASLVISFFFFFLFANCSWCKHVTKTSWAPRALDNYTKAYSSHLYISRDTKERIRVANAMQSRERERETRESGWRLSSLVCGVCVQLWALAAVQERKSFRGELSRRALNRWDWKAIKYTAAAYGRRII